MLIEGVIADVVHVDGKFFECIGEFLAAFFHVVGNPEILFGIVGRRD